MSTAKPQPRPEKPLFLTIKADLSLAIGNDPIPRAQLGAAIDAATQNDRQKRIFLRADKTVPYGELMRVMNLLRSAGYLKVALVGLEGVGGPAARPDGAKSREPALIPDKAQWFPSVDLVEPRRRWLTRWIGAATLISAIHLGGGSLAMLYWQEEFVEEAPGAIVVEIAPRRRKRVFLGRARSAQPAGPFVGADEDGQRREALIRLSHNNRIIRP